MTDYTAFDLFTGIGSMSLAAQNAGFRIVGALDCSPEAVKMYNKNFSGEICLLDRVENLENTSIPETDILIGRIPFNLFTHAGTIRESSSTKYMLKYRALYSIRFFRS